MNIKKEEILNLYRIATKFGEINTTNALEKLLGKETFIPIKKTKSMIDRIKTFEDAEELLGNQHPLVEACDSCEFPGDDCLNAYLKLRVICAALNENSTLDPEYLMYYPKFELLYEDECEYYKKEGKIFINIERYNTSYYGMRFLKSDFPFENTPQRYGNQLCLNTEELASYCGEQFIDLWADFLFTKK